MRSLLNQDRFQVTENEAFPEVITQCKTVFRKAQQGTWITDEVRRAYISLHKSGYAHSAECWRDGELVGGLYGIKIGKVFFGESMFSRESNASKYVFIKYVEKLSAEDVQLIENHWVQG
jgi:leucyl/phenylalanyl-tRNA--protein transferase